MRLVSLRLEQFRNYAHFEGDFHPDTNLIYGENAQGKTNLLEALWVLSQGKSFRGGKDQEMIRLGEPASLVWGKIATAQREYQLSCQLFQGQRKQYLKNQVSCQSQGEFSSVFQTVLFCPEDLDLVKGAPQGRRLFLDRAIGQLRPQYAQALQEYQKILLQKRSILKQGTYFQVLPEFNLRLGQVSAMLIHYRAHFIKRLQEAVPPIHLEFSGKQEQLALSYQTLSTVLDPLGGEQAIFQQVMAHQESHLQAEIASCRCLTGCHRDDILFQINGLPVREFASQGQSRTLALSLKLGERDIIFQEMGEYPLLLLDDVLSELDSRRQEYVLNRIQHGQTFITCCSKEGFTALKEGGMFGIAQGSVIHQG